MKTNIFGKLALVACYALVISACNDNERIVEYNKLTLDKNEAVFDLDKSDNLTAEFNITEGNGNYKVSVEDAEVAEVTIDGTKVTVTALRVGETTAKVYDWVKHSAEIRIKVIDKFELSDSELEMLYGEIRSIEIYSGNGDYQVASSNEDVASVAVEGGFINITAVGAGEADVTVTDAEGKTTTIKVTVNYKEFTLGDYEDPIALNIDETKEIEIVSANGDCIVENTNEESVSAQISEDGKKIVLKAVKFGEAVITVTDHSGESKTIKVAVNPAELTLSTEDVVVYAGENSLIDILSGNGKYEISSDNDGIATAEITEEGKIQINGLSAGSTNITVKDAAEQTKTISVQVKIKLTLEKYEVSNIYTSNVVETLVQITSGNGGYSATAVAPLAAEIRNVEGNDYVVLKPDGQNKEGYNLTATVTDADGQTATITVHIMHRDYLTDTNSRYFVNKEFKLKNDKIRNITIDNDGYFLIRVYSESGWINKTYEGYSVTFKYPGDVQPEKIQEGAIELVKIWKEGTGEYNKSNCSDARVDKVTTDGSGNVNGVWLSFQESGVDARSYVICVP